jgi:hypothetical protein
LKASDIIKYLENIGLQELDDLSYEKSDKLAIVRSGIARKCLVTIKTVRNWRGGATRPGRPAMVLLDNYYREKVAERMGDDK